MNKEITSVIPSGNQDYNSSLVEFTQFKLDNGLKVVLHKDSSIPSIAIVVSYHVGSRDDSFNRKGFAHLFEHLMFEGSPNLKPGEYDNYCTSSGGENNAYTTYDKTSYHLLLPSNCAELGLWLESNRMSGFEVDKEHFEIQKDVVIEEKKQYTDNRPYGTAEANLAESLFTGTCYAWDIIGDVSDISKSKLKDAESFFKTYYTPNNASLAVCGDFDLINIQSLITEYFGSIQRSCEIIRSSFIPIKPNAKTEIVYDNIHTPGIFSAYLIPPENTREYYAFQLLCIILSMGESSRLNKEILYNKQLVSDIGCFVDARELSSVFSFYAFLLQNKNCNQVESEISRILEDIKCNGITKAELKKALNIIEMRSMMMKQTILSKAETLSHYSIIFDTPGLINTNINNYFDITEDEILLYTNNYLRPDNKVTLFYYPYQTTNV